MKNFNSLQIKELKKELKSSFLTKEKFDFYRIKFEFSYEMFKRALIFNNIPFKSGDVRLALRSLKINVVDKSIKYSDFLLIEKKYLHEFKDSKIKILFKCSECNNEGSSRISHFLTRKFLKMEPICAKCINKKVSNIEEVIKKNSKIQKIAQNKKKTKEKNRNSQLKRFEDPTTLKQHSEAAKKTWKNPEYRKKMEKIAKEKWDDIEYAKKVIEHSKNGGLKGIYKGVYYDSGYELAYLLMMENKGELNKIERAYLKIEYVNKDNLKSRYFPDFIYEKIYIIEVKGYAPWTDLKNICLKNKAASYWAKQNKMRFRVIELKDFGYHWYRKARIMHKKLQDDKIKI